MRLGGERERCAPAAELWLVPVHRDGTPRETESMNEVPTNETLENAPEAAPSRRSFLTRAAGVSALAVPTLTLITSRKAQASGSHKLTGLKAELITEIMNDEAQHVP